MTALKPDSNSTKTWSHPPAIIYRKYYFFEVLNADQLSSGESTMPSIKQRGPYVYEEVMEKRNIKFSDDIQNVTYSPVSTLYFRAELSVGSDNDSFTFLNIPLLVYEIYSFEINKNTNSFNLKGYK